MANTPTEPIAGDNDRDQLGRFAKGNSGGPGNPFGGKIAKFRTLLMETMTDEDMQDIVNKLIEIAKEGNMQAIKLVLGYTIGKPGAMPPAPDSGFGDAGSAGSLAGGSRISEWPDVLNPAPSPNGVFCDAGEVQIATGNGDKPGGFHSASREQRPRKGKK